MGEALNDIILEEATKIVKNPIFWIFIGLGVVVTATVNYLSDQ